MTSVTPATITQIGAQALGSHARTPEWFNVKDYNGKGDDAADDTDALLAAVAAAAPVKGVVSLPPGVFRIASRIVLPDGVTLSGSGSAYTLGESSTIKCTTAGAGISVGATGTPSVGGGVNNVTIDGNSVATNPLFMGRRVSAHVFDVDIKNTASGGTGFLIQEAQNGLFERMEISGSGTAYCLDLGTGSHTFISCFSIGSTAQAMLITQSAPAAPGLFSVPSYNVFIQCGMEGTSATSRAALVHEAGLGNLFISSGFALSSSSPAGTYAIDTTVLGTNINGNLKLDSCTLLGLTGANTALKLGNGVSVYVYGATLFQGFAVQYELSNVNGSILEGAITLTGVTARSSGPGASNTIIRDKRYSRFDITRQSATDLILTASVDGEAGTRTWLEPTRVGFGSGATGAPDVIFARSAGQAQITGSAGIWLAPTAGTGYLGLNKQNPVPGSAAANTGRLFLQDNGAGKMQLVIKFPTGVAQIIATEP